ncbi:Ribosomal RNA small subunit methyltransferase I [Stanieria cyanosphaera PCC 7437]|uniref:Ribosomal RNA small subunit methyltransferase I n=1 Tax=Stanieria cyanosphaera (strain ATCC 29371 / PCC 7437) TaxID=111780 RepID=K9XW48_STAC7|nr:16S rRNA (cytidine(1402)-2'-O)-methyltransferase [Stanieria cyanosphaera]AFZ36294.1 Ribosomal RNA small subunit methyltransferase I [Stanieria cyanosphaera PCC 7437]
MSKNLVLGKLYLVGTPIGNVEDITLRAIRILQEVDLIAAEDTRHTGKLLQHLQINTSQISYHEHNQATRIPELLTRLQEGKDIAVVSDAGMPSISDPGYQLVKAAVELGIEVIPIPGITAAITALAASGLATARFVFEGFLPYKNKERTTRLDEIKDQSRTMIFYEAPHRLLSTLKDLEQVLGSERKIVLARELTKLYEEFWRGTIADAIALYTEVRQPKGEYTLVIAGKPVATNVTLSETELKHQLEQLLQQGMNKSQASRHLASLTTQSRQEIYQIAIAMSKQNSES